MRQWSINGFAWMVFRDQDFEVTGVKPRMEISGKDILDEIFNLRDVSGWGMFGVLMAYVFFFRFNQYFLFAIQTGKIRIPFLSKRKVVAPAPVSAAESAPKIASSEGAATSETSPAQKLEISTGEAAL